jgi:hypothetical protein
MNVNEKGIIGLLKVTTDLYSRGYTCFTPVDDYNPVDCIAMKDGKLYRLQVKYRSPGKHGSYEIRSRSTVNGKNIQIDRNLIDMWAVYLSDKDKVVYIPISEMNGKTTIKINEAVIKKMERGLDGKAADC